MRTLLLGGATVAALIVGTSAIAAGRTRSHGGSGSSGVGCTTSASPGCILALGAANASATAASLTGTLDPGAVTGAIQAGYNWQVDNVVYGLASDLSWFNLGGLRQVSINYPMTAQNIAARSLALHASRALGLCRIEPPRLCDRRTCPDRFSDGKFFRQSRRARRLRRRQQFGSARRLDRRWRSRMGRDRSLDRQGGIPVRQFGQRRDLESRHRSRLRRLLQRPWHLFGFDRPYRARRGELQILTGPRIFPRCRRKNRSRPAAP
jgi:hypothetical protein